jgi:hypothetical protein
MNCSEAAECVSALFDGAPISREVAGHLSDCQECRVRLNEYAEMSAELRRMASAAAPQSIPEGQWRLAEPPAANWLKKWRGTMRIPRFAFALMVLSLVALSLFTGLFLTRAKETYRWFQYELSGRDGKMITRGTVPTNPGGNPYYDSEAGMSYADGTVWFHVRMLEQVGEAEKIGARTLWHPRGEPYGNQFYERLRRMPEREFLYSPGEGLKIPVDGYGNLEIKGHFESTLPENVRMGLYPEDGKFRVNPPVVLVRGKEMLMKGDMGGGYASLDESYFAYGDQEHGWYLFSAKPIAGAVEGTLTMNQIEFELDGRHYFLFTGDPILFGRVKIWVKHYPSIQDFDPTSPGMDWAAENGPALAFGELKNLAVEKEGSSLK